MRTTLLKTKLYRPLVRPELVSRPYLMRRLDEGFNSKLTVVSAPAGYGKTTLVSAWAFECKYPVAWLTLDKEDNDPVRFLTYVITAAQTIKPGLGQEILSVIQSAQPPAIINLLPALINQIDDVQMRFVLVLDDYHVIASPEIHEAITFIIDHQPPQMYLLLTTRIDPPLPLPQLRGRGQLTELRQADLRFSEEETVAFLKQGSGIELTSRDVNMLVNRTEGWIAGLQMAALSMRNKKDISRFIEGFGGSHEYIVDYFDSEVLNNLPEPVRSFLLKTSFLDQLCGPLCDKVSGQIGSQQMLERLQEANLFLVPLDDEHIWYRYHQLFADLLQKTLKQINPMGAPELHLRASQWFEQNEFPHQAIEHAFLADDYPRAARLLEDAAEPALGRGEHLWLLKRIEKLPEEQMEDHLRLSVLRATILTSTGTLQQAEAALQKIEAYTSAHPTSMPIHDYVIGRVVALHAMIAIQRGDVENAKQNAQLALEKLPKGARHEAPWRAELLLALGLSNFAMGDLAEARQNLDMAIEDSKLGGDPYTFLFVTAYLVDVLWSQGLLKEAVERCQEGLKFIDEHNLAWTPISGEVLIRWCLLLCEVFDLSQAEDFLNRGIELIRRGGVPWALAWAYHMKMFYLIAQGDLLAADTAGQEADQLPQLTELPARVLSGISALKVLICVRLGKLDEAEQHLKKRGIWTGSKIRYPYHREFQSLAALLIAKGDLVNAETLIESMIDWAEATKQYRTLICARVLQSLACAAQKDMQKALQSLGLAMDLAEPEGYFQTILEVGRPIIPLLYEAVQKGLHPGFSTRLLTGFKETRPNPLVTSDTQKRQSDILTPLRVREIEVLKLVAGGQTNKEIANKLHISLRTVKFHMTCIFTKLGVDNRVQAVAKAKILGIL
jgi:LuxR family transcriptional regulator, maltose regulon positive regulatory protein